MHKVFQVVLKYIGWPLVERLAAYLISEIKKWIEIQKKEKEIKRAVKKLKESKTHDEIIDTLRDLNL